MDIWGEKWKKEIEISDFHSEREPISTFVPIPKGKGIQYEVIFHKDFVNILNNDVQDESVRLECAKSVLTFHLCQWHMHKHKKPYISGGDEFEEELKRIGWVSIDDIL
jgi:hypothetical protein